MAQNYFGDFAPTLAGSAQCNAPIYQWQDGELEATLRELEEPQVNHFPGFANTSQQGAAAGAAAAGASAAGASAAGAAAAGIHATEPGENVVRLSEADFADPYYKEWSKIMRGITVSNGQQLLKAVGIKKTEWTTKRAELRSRILSRKTSWFHKVESLSWKLHAWFNVALAKRYERVLLSRAAQLPDSDRRFLHAAIKDALNDFVELHEDEEEFEAKFVASGQTLGAFLRGYDNATATAIRVSWCKTNPVHSLYK
jgi:hypothetical protein